MRVAYRIADARHPIYDGTGAMLHGRPLNSPGLPVIYAAESHAGAMLEVLVRANLCVLPKHPPDGGDPHTRLSHLRDAPSLRAARLDEEDLSVTRSFGDLWLHEARSAYCECPVL